MHHNYGTNVVYKKNLHLAGGDWGMQSFRHYTFLFGGMATNHPLSNSVPLVLPRTLQSRPPLCSPSQELARSTAPVAARGLPCSPSRKRLVTATSWTGKSGGDRTPPHP